MKYLFQLSIILSCLLLLNGCKDDETEPEDKVIPTSMTITRIDLESWIIDKFGGTTPWDPNGGLPDAFLSLAQGPTPSAYTTFSIDTPIQDIFPGTIYTFENLNWILTNMNSRHTLGLYDEDIDTNELMGQVSIVPKSLCEGLPAEIFLDGTVKATIHVTWNY